MKRSLAILLVVAVFAPAAALIAMAFSCHAMPCCAKAQNTAELTSGCCAPTVSSDPKPASPAKNVSTAKASLTDVVSAEAVRVFEVARASHPDVSPPQPTRVRLATLSTLLI